MITYYIKFIINNKNNTFCIPESLNSNNLHQLFDYKITFVIFQHENTISEGFQRSF